MERANKQTLALFLGAGFSAAVGLPTTREIRDQLLTDDGSSCEHVVSSILRQFWRDVFGWKEGAPRASLEDHFTQIDLAANAGHMLGTYEPRQLRAIRRMTIHRVFSLVGAEPIPSPAMQRFIDLLLEECDFTVITTNWDAWLDSILKKQHRKEPAYPGSYDKHGKPCTGDVWFAKLHGAANWEYCDSCQGFTIQSWTEESIAARRLLLRPDDFRIVGHERAAREPDDIFWKKLAECGKCRRRLGTRVGTFSYRKHLSVPDLYPAWDLARRALIAADRWLFVGYSMPEADIEVRHLLKSAELRRALVAGTPLIRVVLKGDPEAGSRFRSLFGLPADAIFQCGLEAWVEQCFDSFLRMKPPAPRSRSGRSGNTFEFEDD